MLLSVRHTTLYQFEMPMRFVTQSHRLTPVANGSQRVVDWSVSAEGAEFGASFVDGAGDAVSTLTAQGPVESLAVVVEGTVETTDTAGVLRNNRELVSPRVYLGATRATESNRALVELGKSALAGSEPGDALDRAHRLSAAVSDAVVYRTGVTEAQTTAAEALEAGEGVCQDMAHVLIALAREAELPARYVTGYLLAGEDVAVGDAGHAWAEIHVEGLGWVGFDAANRCCPDARYIRLGSGRDAREAAPIRGVSRGGGDEAMDVSVAVSAQQ